MNNKKVISAVLLVSDGPIEHSYFEELLKIENTVLISIFEQINTDLTNADIGFYIKFDKSKSDIVTKSEISELLTDVKPPPIKRFIHTSIRNFSNSGLRATSNKNENIRN